ncbi:hypothetical protein ASPWEDRAFT_174336 [Aspergillus wentii DTO 134E9]|uniref:Zn(2)-C6 fungal-type domain-containing protein n=1 Tax=Aspergillus wentii DTO 134E9 TaxID=1073089 RepID=A0A1L9RDA5_ASPWE|nr:uncharacterized protein ASPWEDRAFT_174336 [Aspergillus wentii DTO 134E9]OJJ32906.1 hypothetical protein ASPWEDRAFT_174336 [Aspergillus wentii DTO 134E9]
MDLQSGFRLRRTHEKSRRGCLRCKHQRKKCDELRPSCSRCTKRAYPCRYQGVSEQESPRPAISPGVVGSASNTSSSSGQPALRYNTEESFISSQNGTLDATELSLLAHYLTHTSQTIPFDHLDLYALSVGVPNLAFNCNFVMASLLALAAACKCHDIAKQAPSPLDHQTVSSIKELLALAERHHTASLRHVQAAMQNSGSYDSVLATAALMVLYASASHSIRVHLAATAKDCGRRLPSEVLPQHSQWISFTRAAHTASTAVLKDMVDQDQECTATTPDVDTRIPGAVLSPQDGPSESTKKLFLPLVESTYRRALESLRRRGESTVSSCDSIQLHASLATISVLEKCASAALSTDSNRVEPPNQPRLFTESSNVTPWVARYMISVTSMESPQALRRIIMSFLNKAPAEYLSLVQSVLDAPSEEECLDATNFLAMDIFAHWLVLVMLLDGVWWIGDIGQWELGQVVAFMKSRTGERWWPGSMYLVKRELHLQ